MNGSLTTRESNTKEPNAINNLFPNYIFVGLGSIILSFLVFGLSVKLYKTFKSAKRKRVNHSGHNEDTEINIRNTTSHNIQQEYQTAYDVISERSKTENVYPSVKEENGEINDISEMQIPISTASLENCERQLLVQLKLPLLRRGTETRFSADDLGNEICSNEWNISTIPSDTYLSPISIPTTKKDYSDNC